ncbi:MAG: hypothetical protein ACE5JL_00850 [Dehalococcoidia bacterium]
MSTILDTARPGHTCHKVAVEANRAHAWVDDEGYFSGAYGYAVGAQFHPS